MALLAWPMPAPRKVEENRLNNTPYPEELWVWWSHDPHMLPVYDGLFCHFALSRHVMVYHALDSSDEGDPRCGHVDYTLSYASLFQRMIHRECPACHNWAARWPPGSDDGFCEACHACISS